MSNANHVNYFPTDEHLCRYLRNGGLVQDMLNKSRVFRMVKVYATEVVQTRELGSYEWVTSDSTRLFNANRKPGRLQPLGPDQDRYGGQAVKRSTLPRGARLTPGLMVRSMVATMVFGQGHDFVPDLSSDAKVLQQVAPQGWQLAKARKRDAKILAHATFVVAGSILCTALMVPDRLHRKVFGAKHHVRKFGG